MNTQNDLHIKWRTTHYWWCLSKGNSVTLVETVLDCVYVQLLFCLKEVLCSQMQTNWAWKLWQKTKLAGNTGTLINPKQQSQRKQGESIKTINLLCLFSLYTLFVKFTVYFFRWIYSKITIMNTGFKHSLSSKELSNLASI